MITSYYPAGRKYKRGYPEHCINLSDFTKVYESNDHKNTDSWISAKDKLPDKSGRYLTYAEQTVYCNDNNITYDMRINVLYFDNKEWYNDECIYYDVLYWMPLPKSPVD
jgi:hypothetical protein